MVRNSDLHNSSVGTNGAALGGGGGPKTPREYSDERKIRMHKKEGGKKKVPPQVRNGQKTQNGVRKACIGRGKCSGSRK